MVIRDTGSQMQSDKQDKMCHPKLSCSARLRGETFDSYYSKSNQVDLLQVKLSPVLSHLSRLIHRKKTIIREFPTHEFIVIF